MIRKSGYRFSEKDHAQRERIFVAVTGGTKNATLEEK
jgi:hypothetical protein